MDKHRLAAFSDGVIAIIITIMVLELKPPHDPGLDALLALAPVFSAYVLSFVYVAIYWNNHHHLLHAAHHVNGAILWANTHLLFWLSLIPFTTAWMSENHFAPLPVAVYGVSLLAPAIAYYILTKALLSAHDADSTLAQALTSVRKERASLAIYAVGVAAALYHPYVALALYVLVALMWLAPDRRIERALHDR